VGLNVSRETISRGGLVKSDYLVIGSGIAGLSFALRVSQWGNVIVVTKKRDIDTATNLAQGGIAAVFDEHDSIKEHVDDTLKSGAGLCDENIVNQVVSSGRARVEDLIHYGVPFVRDEESGALSLGREGGHSRRRVAHAYDLTGREIEKTLLDMVRKSKNIKLLEEHVAVDLLIKKSGVEQLCFGAYVMSKDRGVIPYVSKVTVLCTGGAGKVYLYTSNPDIATGDGVAMAARAGAKIANMEFVQFHPTCLYHPNAKNFLISEAVRGEGGILVDKRGKRFMDKYDVHGELATRDTVARSIDKELKESGEDCVYLDITHKDPAFIKERFPGIYKKCLEFGLDITTEPIPVVPAAHYLCGGVLVDSYGNSSVSGLMALGETSCTGLHGANRLASNSLLEAVVFAERAAGICFADQKTDTDFESIDDVDPWSEGEADYLEEEIIINHDWDLIRRTMWNYVGIVRTTQRLELAQKRLTDIAEEIEVHYKKYYVSANMVELRNIAHIALMIVESALARKESRGLHYSIDFPDQRDCFRHWIVLERTLAKPPWSYSITKQSFAFDINES
jgi:L-aspartate oxidase